MSRRESVVAYKDSTGYRLGRFGPFSENEAVAHLRKTRFWLLARRWLRSIEMGRAAKLTAIIKSEG